MFLFLVTKRLCFLLALIRLINFNLLPLKLIHCLQQRVQSINQLVSTTYITYFYCCVVHKFWIRFFFFFFLTGNIVCDCSRRTIHTLVGLCSFHTATMVANHSFGGQSGNVAKPLWSNECLFDVWVCMLCRIGCRAIGRVEWHFASQSVPHDWERHGWYVVFADGDHARHGSHLEPAQRTCHGRLSSRRWQLSLAFTFEHRSKFFCC